MEITGITLQWINHLIRIKIITKFRITIKTLTITNSKTLGKIMYKQINKWTQDTIMDGGVLKYLGIINDITISLLSLKK
jgi:hypothetical protein